MFMPTSTNVSESEFLNRELSWLQFNQRVLAEAIDERNPLLERVNFLSIFRSNLDEFFMKRVGGLKRQVVVGVTSKLTADLSPEAQLAGIRSEILSLMERQSECCVSRLRPALETEGIRFVRWDELTAEERKLADQFFSDKVFPVLTPLAVDPGHPFPFLSNLSTSLGILLKHPTREEDQLFARVKIPDVFPAWIRVDGGASERAARFLSLNEMVARNLGTLFPGMEVIDFMAFRITRNADIERDEEDAEDLLEMIEEELRERRFAKVVRLELGPKPNPRILSLLMDELDLGPQDLYEYSLDLEYYTLKVLAEVSRPDLKFPAWIPIVPAVVASEEVNFFELIRESDFLVHHPYESFTATVEAFIRSAVADPLVVAIKMTLYRTAEDGPFIPLLIQAAERGKQVVCIVEVKARFDEQRNILIAEKLEKAGVHVVYGVVGLKTHSKVALVVRRERDSLKCYAHIGTGNYHPQTAKLYTDLGFFTSNPILTNDVVHLFHYLTGRSLFHDYQMLVVAPIAMRQKLLALIHRETANARGGKPARIIAKMNSLEEKEICRAIYQASRAGVKIDLIVRGVCALRPGVPGLSENIRVISVIGRFLEHSRIFHFANGSDDPLEGDFLIGSADWMYRNLNLRVEVVVPIEVRPLRERLWQILGIHLDDTRQAWEMKPDGTYQRREDPPTGPRHPGSHAALMEITLRREMADPAKAPH